MSILRSAFGDRSILVAQRTSDWRGAVWLAGEGLVASGRTTPDYTSQMVATVEELGPYIVLAPGLALAHAHPGPAVLNQGLSLVTLATPVNFGNPKNDPVDVVIGLAASDHEGHLDLMGALAVFLSDDNMMTKLRKVTVREELLELLD